MIEFWRSRLSDSSKKQYDVLCNAIRHQRRSAELNKTLNIVNEIQKVYQYILSDHPELYYASPQLSIATSVFSSNANISYLYDAKQRRDIDQSFIGLKTALAKESNKSDIEKAFTAAYLIMKDSRYEINNLYNQNAASAIHYHVAQCSGFSSAFKYAMDVMGIWCIIVSGSVSSALQSGPHSWNIVKLNDAYYHIDVTSLASIALTDINQLYRCQLLASDAQKKQQGYIWDSSETPMCSEIDTRSYAGYHAQTTGSENATNHSRLPTYTRLFDVQAKIRECLKTKTTYYEFVLNISMYSDEKLMRMVSNYLSEQGNELSLSYEAEVGCVNGIFYLKIKYKN